MILTNIFYMYSNMDESSQILLFLIVLVALMLVSIFIINLITKKRIEKYDKKFNPITKYKTTVKREVKVQKPAVKEEKIIKYEKPLVETQKIVKEEPIEVMDDSEVIEVISDDNTIEKISTLIEDNMNNPKPINLTKFEEDEEKNAIISYDELVRKAGAKKIVYKTQTISEPVKEEKIQVKHEENNSKFKASQVISPIYGRKKEVVKKTDELEEFVDLDNIPVKNNSNINDEQMMKDITFLTNLKTFRSNLD